MVQFILNENGEKAFAVLPIDEFLSMESLMLGESDSGINEPDEIVFLMRKFNFNSLGAWRRHLGISQKDMAVKMGLSQSQISNIETVPSLDQIQAYKKILKIPSDANKKT